MSDTRDQQQHINALPLEGQFDEKKEYPIDKKEEDVTSVHDAENTQKVQTDLVVLQHDVDEVYDRAMQLSLEEVTDILEDAWVEHSTDPNFPSQVKDRIEYFLSGDASTLENYELLADEMRIEAALIRFSSPYPEVRAVVSCTDDYDMPTSTFRVYFLGVIWCAGGTFLNQFFSLRYPTFSVSVNEMQILSYPAAKALEWLLPTTVWKVFGYNMTLNSGRFNEKEHMLLTIMGNAGLGAPYTQYVILVQVMPLFYDQPWAKNFGYQMLMGLSVQLIGMGFAGLARRFIVYPEHCIWLLNLSTIALNRSFHATTNHIANGWKISRMRFFLYAFCGMFVYFWLPGSLFQALSITNWTTWIAPGSMMLATISGTVRGAGFTPLATLDWNMMNGTNALILPFFATANNFIGLFISSFIIIAMWYTNAWNTGYLPLVSNTTYANTAKAFNVTRILDPITKNLDYKRYEAYSRPYMAASQIVLYGAFFAAYSALVCHTLLYHRREIVNGFKTAYKSIRAGQKGNSAFKDYHNQQMAKYSEVPETWYLGLTIFAVVLGVIGLTCYPTHTSVSAIFFGIFLCLLFLIPIGIVYSVTGTEITLNVFAEFIGGLIYPENALAMNYFKTFGVMTTINALLFAQDLKLAHYLKIGQRHTFVVQIVGATIAAFSGMAAVNYQVASVPKLCQPDQPNKFVCNGIQTFFTASVFWGSLGPHRVFGTGGLYPELIYSFLVGFFLVIPFYFAAKRWPKSWVASVHVPVLLMGAVQWGTYSNVGVWFWNLIFGWVFQVYIKKKYLAWWSKYNYVLATAFGAGVSLAGVIIYAVLQQTELEPTWWGNQVSFQGCDYTGCRRLLVDPVTKIFGDAPNTGAWH